MANKCAIASRVDCFSEAPTDKFGSIMKGQVEERLRFVASGAKPRKNKDVMNEIIGELKEEGLFYGDKVRVAKEAGDDIESDNEVVEEKKKSKKDKKEKKEKKSKKRKHSDVDSDEEIEEIKPKKKKRKTSD